MEANHSNCFPFIAFVFLPFIWSSKSLKCYNNNSLNKFSWLKVMKICWEPALSINNLEAETTWEKYWRNLDEGKILLNIYVDSFRSGWAEKMIEERLFLIYLSFIVIMFEDIDKNCP